MIGSNYPKVLVGCPINQKKDYCLPQFIETVMNLMYPNFDIYLSDNSENKNYHRNIYRKYGIECDHLVPDTDHPMAGIAASQNQIRTRCLFGGYDFLFSLEQDVTPPTPYIIELLMNHHKDFVSAPYYIGTNENSTIAMMDIEPFYYNPQNRLLPFEESAFKLNGQLIETHGAGLGCALIHRSVLETIPPFGFLPEKKHIPSDTFFYLDCKKVGIPLYLDTSLICKHNNQEWKIN